MLGGYKLEYRLCSHYKSIRNFLHLFPLISSSFSEHWRSQNMSSLLTRAAPLEQFFMLNLFRTFPKLAFWDNHNINPHGTTQLINLNANHIYIYI